MRYVGGKARIAKKLTKFLTGQRKPGQLFIEPFLGGCNILPLMDNPRHGNEINPDLIMLYEAVKGGWLPPTNVSEAEYNRLKHAESSALRGFVGITCSFAGRWFEGYARDNSGRNYAKSGYNNCVRLAKQLQGATFSAKNYLDMKSSVKGAMIYCDPPYFNTKKYKHQKNFCTEQFWEWVRKFSKNNDVYVSEYTAPDDFEAVWSVEKMLGLRTNSGGQEKRVEKLFKLKSNFI